MRSALASPAKSLLALALATFGGALADEPHDHWEAGSPRPFLSAQVDLGSSEHLALAAGYGKPHSTWGGLMVEGFLTDRWAALRLGGKVDLQAIALEAGLRLDSSFRSLPLPDLHRHTRLSEGNGFDSRLLDLSASGGLPLGPGYVLYEALGVRELSSLGSVQVYDELLRIVYRPPWLATASAGWVASLRGGALLLGGRAQWAFATGRGGDPFIRLGPVAYWRLEPRLALAAELLYPVSTPDRLGLVDQVSAFVVLSFTAATGDQPRLP
ncbi:MAG TPA: hypothetical protein VFG59_07760 [Anaeromyxobacter sp.]|nr:hypothetical protein [Anaeromyxobacter sp.]